MSTDKGGIAMTVLNITRENFQKEVLESEKPVLLDFFASWCGPCRMLSPIVDEIAAEREDIKVGKVNIDEEMELAEQFQIMSVPTLIAMKGGAVVEKALGVRPKSQVLAMLA